jgi:hypothetical protein
VPTAISQGDLDVRDPRLRAGRAASGRRHGRRGPSDPVRADPAAGGDLLAPDLPSAAEAHEGPPGDAVGHQPRRHRGDLGRLVGKVTKAVDGEDLEVEIAQGTRVKIVRGICITDVRSKSTPVNDNKAGVSA